jgi:hypothetical protein
MGRIRTIKPEFPHSESMGAVSRDARLLFLLLLTVADDSGRTRGALRLLASLLFPYDDDAPPKIGDWIAELEEQGCVVRYEVDGSAYLQIRNWAKHQKIDKPTASRIPPLAESSPSPRRALADDSSLDLGSRTMDQVPERARADARPDSVGGASPETEPDPEPPPSRAPVPDRAKPPSRPPPCRRRSNSSRTGS